MRSSRTAIALATAAASLAALTGPAREARADASEIRPAFGALERKPDPQATYDANKFEIIHVESTSIGTFWNSTTTWWRVTRGVYRVPTVYGDFYRALGRADLAAAEESRHAWGEALYWGGLLAMAGGFIGGGWELVHHREVGAVVGAGFVVGGFVSMQIGAPLTRPGLNESDASDLAHRYDEALARHLGVGF